MGSIWKGELKNKNISLYLRKLVCGQCVLSMVKYGPVTWTIMERTMSKLPRERWSFISERLKTKYTDQRRIKHERYHRTVAGQKSNFVEHFTRLKDEDGLVQYWN